MSWQELAKTLSLGQKRKVKHCGTEPSAYVSNNAKGISLHCFRCGETVFHPHGRLSAQAILALRERDDEEVTRPYPSVVGLDSADVPSAARVWVLKAGLTPERATTQYGLGWSARSCRVIVPVLHNGHATGQWTGRAIDGRKPKYIMPRGSVGAQWYRLLGDRAKAVVLVEDILSAIKVSEAGHDVLAILGTSAQSVSLQRIADYAKVVVWLDPDTAGNKGYVSIRRALAPYGLDPIKIVTERDPKLHSRDEINQYIEDAT